MWCVESDDYFSLFQKEGLEEMQQVWNTSVLLLARSDSEELEQCTEDVVMMMEVKQKQQLFEPLLAVGRSVYPSYRCSGRSSRRDPASAAIISVLGEGAGTKKGGRRRG